MKTWLAVGLFALQLALNLPIFLSGEFLYRDSIERGYAGMTRFLAEHPNPWGWDPVQYCGLPTQFIYLPLLHYLSALLSWISRQPPESAYRWITGVLVCAGPVTLYAFVCFFARSVRWAALTALAYSFFSPSYGLIKTIAADRGGAVYLPWHLQVFLKYGEGPHNAGLTLMPLALIAVWLAATRRKYADLFLAAVLLAAVTLTNWVAALATAVCVLLLILAGARHGGFSIRRVLGAGALGYLFACAWLTPTFVRTIVFNWPADAFDYRLQQSQGWLLAGLIAAVLLLRFVLHRLGAGVYATFVTLCLLTFSWLVFSYYGSGLDPIPESRRYAIEFEFFFFLALFEFFRLSLASPDWFIRGTAIAPALLLFLAGLGQPAACLSQGWSRWAPLPREQTIEYRLAKWLNDARPRGRILASGGLRFHLNAWYLLPQVGGTFETGIRNRVPHDLYYQIRTGLRSQPAREGADALLEMRALGVEYVIVHGEESQEHYRDYRNPRKFDGLLERVHEDGDNYVYRVPFTSYAHLVTAAELPAVPPTQGRMAALAPLVAAMDDSSRPRLAARWLDTTHVTIDGPLPAGMTVTTSINWNEGWSATQNGEPVAIESNRLGFIVVHPRPAADAHLELRFQEPPESRLMALISAIAWILALRKLWRTLAPAIMKRNAEAQDAAVARA